MTVNKNTKTTSKKKSTSSSSATASTSTSSTQQQKSSTKKVSSSQTNKSETGVLSKSSSASSLRIADVSHLPINANVVSYTVTEMLPTGAEKITTYGDTGATSTEYKHAVVMQDSSATSTSHSTQIQQLSSTLNESTSNLSCASGSTYTVTEPREEYKLTYNKNDSGWNGKFVLEEPVSKKNTVVEQSSTSSSHQESSSIAKSSSSSYVVEIVDGKERIVDKKHHESGHAQASSNDEFLATKSGTNITPEVHFKQKVKESSSKYDSAVPELKQPKGVTSESEREVHQVGDSVSSKQSRTQEKLLGQEVKHTLKDHTKDFITSEKIDTDTKASNLTDKGQTETVTTTYTYYDSKGNVIKTTTDVDTHAVPTTSKSSTKKVSSSSKTDSKNFYEHSVDTKETSSNVYDSKAVQNTTGSTVILDQTTSQHKPVRKGASPTRKPLKEPSPGGTTSTVWVDENYVDTNKIRQAQTSTDSKNFYGHSVDSKHTVVDNIYDSKATQNTIGTSGRVLKDHTIESSDVIYSNDRNYGKTGWNGEFTYEKPQQPQKGSPQPTRKRTESPSKRGKPSKEPSPSRKGPEGTTTTVWVDENYVDTSKIRQAQTSTDSKNFYGHTIDSKHTLVDNTYDSKATQNTIGTAGRILKDHTMDTTDVIYSNDRLYGKTGWNGKFVYEQPQDKTKKPGDQDKPAAGKPTKKAATKKTPTGKSPTRKPKGPTDSTTDFLTTEIQETVNQFTDKVSKDSTNILDQTFIIVDGQKVVPTQPGPTVVTLPTTDSKTTVETYESVSKFSDSKTSVTKDSQTFEDHQTSREHYTTHDKWDSSKPEGPTNIKLIDDKTVTHVTDLKSSDIKVSEDVKVDQQSTKQKLSTTSDTKIVKDVKIVDSVDQVNKTIIQENIVDIKDIVS